MRSLIYLLPPPPPPRVFLSGFRAVSRLLVAEFYGSTLWYPAQCLVELNRLQENFHGYGEDADRHLMLLATSLDDGSLVGFVDVDGREKRPGQSECGLDCVVRWWAGIPRYLRVTSRLLRLNRRTLPRLWICTPGAVVAL